ncbi:MAG: serine/threonine-protein kinase [Acidimicrobiales bacterium]
MQPVRELLAAALPGYEIGEEIGRGGLGVVYEGRHRGLGRAVAIKLLSNTLQADGGLRERFIFEARLVAGLDHPHIVPVYDFVEYEGLCVIVMELCRGGTLWSRFRTRGLRTDEAVAVVLATAVGLHHAHSNRVLHRDVKPDNILFSGAGTVKIADFGIAKSLAGDAGQRTATGSLVGTPAYMAPEQATGDPVSPATDVYALGVVLYELLTGERPYREVTEPMAQLFQHVNDDPRPMAEVFPGVPPQLEAVTRRALAKAPADRPASAEQFAVELAEAATTLLGVGWLAKSGTPVMSASSVIGATERLRAPLFGTQTTGPVSSTQGGPWSTPAPASLPASQSPDASALPALAAAGSEPTGRRWGPRLAAMIGGGVVAALVVLTAVVLLRPSGQDDAEPGGTSTTLANRSAIGGASASSASVVLEEPISVLEVRQFLNLCTSGGVSERRCQCAVDGSVEQLTAAQFRGNLALMATPTPALTSEVESIFETCKAQGL